MTDGDNKVFESEGGCLCGGVRFSVVAPAAEVGLCHCKMCRRWGGGLPLAVLRGDVRWLKSEHLKWWSSSPWGERGFCGNCGATLCWRAKGDANSHAISAGALDDESALKIVSHIFYDDKAPFYETTDNAPRMTGAAFTARVLAGIAERDGEAARDAALAQCAQQMGEAFAREVKKLL